MKLGTLLAAGKSMMRGHADVSYRASRQAYLPKFGSAKNPFKPETQQSPAETGSPAATTPAATPRPTRADQETVAAGAKQFSSQEQPVPATPAVVVKKKTDWAGKFNPASIFHRATMKSEEKPSDKAQKPAATQTELSLDSVKVVHNDLTDVDVEIVPMKSRSGTTDLQAPKKTWEFLGERLLGIEAS